MQMKSLKMAIMAGLIAMLPGCASVDQTTLPKIPVGSAATAVPGQATRDDYVLFQTVTFGDANKPLAGFSTSGSLAVVKTPKGNMVDYELWTQGRVSPNTNKDKKEFVQGPVRFSRNPTTEEVSFSTKGFGLAEDVINQIMMRVEKHPRTEGTWNQEISLNLLGAHLPRKLAFHFDVQKIELKPGVHALLIRAYTDVFTIEILPTATNTKNGVFSGIYKGVLVYSPEDHRLYQMASDFSAGKSDETLQIQETAFLAGLDGKPVFPLIDMRKVLDLKKEDKPNPLVSMPLWAVQALKVQQVVSLASSTTAERASNPAPLIPLGLPFALDVLPEVASQTLGNLAETYGESHGGTQGKLVAKYFSEGASLSLGAVLPESVLLGGPVVPVLLTAYSLYTIYTALDELYALYQLEAASNIVHRNFFGGQNCDQECFARANAAYDFTVPLQPLADPGPPPEPPPAPKPGKARWVVPTVIGGVAIAAGLAYGLSGSSTSDESDSSSSSECDQSEAYIASNCCKTSNGIQTVSIPHPQRCGNCPSGTTDVGDDNVTANGPYNLCDCNGC